MQNIKRLKKQFVTQQDHIFSGRVRPGTGFNMVTNLFGAVLSSLLEHVVLHEDYRFCGRASPIGRYLVTFQIGS